MNKPVCFNQPILETSKIVSFGMIIGNQNMEKKKKVKLCCVDTDSFIVCIRAEDI